MEAWTNGALVRIAPAAVYAASAKASRTEAAHLALFLARLTHGHPLAVFPAVECALALLSILRGDDRVPDDLIDLPVLDESVREQHRYQEYREVRTRPMKVLPPSTGLWMWRLVFEHLLKMGPGKPWDRLPPFEEGLIRVVSDSYDRDTAGAVAGALLGAYWGASCIPERWVSEVERAAEILQTAEEMAETVRPRRGAFTAVAAANTLRTEVHRFRLDPGRIEDGLTAPMACLQSQWEEEVASGRVGFALLILPEPSANAGRILVLSSKEPVTSFDWMVMNPHLPWKTWEKAARFLEEWKDLPAYSPMGALFSESRFRCAGFFSDRREHVIWEALEPGVLPMVLLDGRWAEPGGGVLCRLEIAPTREDLPGNRIVRLEDRCVQVMERILDASDLPPDPREASFLLDAFRRKARRETTWEDPEVVSRFWWAALELLQADLYGTLAAIAERSSVWQETALHLARVPKDRLLEVFRILRSSPQNDARRLAVRIGIALGDDAPWADLLDLLDDPGPRVRADTLHGLDSLDAPAVKSFLGANAAILPPGASDPPGGPSRQESLDFRLKELLLRIGEDSVGHGRGGWERRPYL